MQEIRKFLFRDSDRHNKVYGLMSYNSESKKFKLEIKKGYPLYEYPIILQASLEQGYSEVPDKYMMMWVKERIIPPDRQNINSILTAAGLKTYDEFGMLMYTGGRCCQDEMYLEEVPESITIDDI